MDPVDYLSRMKARIPSFMTKGTLFEQFLGVIAGGLQEIEQAGFDLLNNRSLLTASGVQLDGIGQIVNLARAAGETDADYRLSLATRVLTFVKSGTPEDVIAAYLAITGAPSVVYTEIYPATFQLAGTPTVDVTDTAVAAAITATIRAAKPAGVNMIVSAIGGFDFSNASEVDGSNNGPLDDAHGFGTYSFKDSVNALNASLLNGILIGNWDPTTPDLLFDGVNDYATVAYNALYDFERTDPMSIFVRFRTLASGWSLFEKGTNDANRRGYRLSIVAGKPRIVLSNVEASNALRVETTTTVNDGANHSACFTYDGTSAPAGVTAYIDGATATKNTVTNTLSATIASASSLINFGKDANGASGFGAGELMEVVLYKRALTGGEVTNLHNGVAISTTNRIARWAVPTTGGTLSRAI